MLIDTHAHLNFSAFEKDLRLIIKRAEKNGIAKIIIPGAKLDSSKKASEIAHKYNSCYAAVGIHPHHADELTEFGNDYIRLELSRLVNNKKIVAIGEIGLDYHRYRDYPPISEKYKKKQKELLLLQINLASEFNLPIIFHCREAFDNQLDLISSYIKSTPKNLHAVFHCFSGEKKHLKKVLDHGFFVGFDGNITYPENKNFHDLVKYTPLDCILSETDAPFLAPLPFRGLRNEPQYITYTIDFISRLKNISQEIINKTTCQNALKLFKL